MNLENLLRKIYFRKDKRHMIVSTKLAVEIKKSQDLLKRMARKKCKKNVRVNLLQASDLVADVFRMERYKMQRRCK